MYSRRLVAMENLLRQQHRSINSSSSVTNNNQHQYGGVSVNGVQNATKYGGEIFNSTLQHESPRWLLLGLAAIPAWILFGNLMVLLAVRYHRSLRSLSNYVIASLALTDFLLAAVVTPLGIYQVVRIYILFDVFALIITM